MIIVVVLPLLFSPLPESDFMQSLVASAQTVHAAPTALSNSSLGLDGEQEKRKAVARLYQTTIGGSEFCSGADAAGAEAFKEALTAFRAANEPLMDLLANSPYMPRLRSSFTEYLRHYMAGRTADSVGRECQALAQVLRGMLDDPAGRRAVQDYVDLLSQ